VISARAGWLTPDEAVLRARYGLADSKFMTVDGEAVHYVDQGQGPAVVLIHGSFGSLRMWNDWATQLSKRYRVIRFDRPRQGLSGPAPAGRTGTQQEGRIVSALTQQLGVDRFFLVATSSAGASGAAYAADHPGQVRGLLLANIAVGAFDPNAGERSATLRFLLSVDRWFKGWHPRELWRQVLLANFFDPGKVTDELAREWAELNNRSQRMPPATQTGNPMAEFDKTVGDLRRMTVPSLLLWSDHDHELPLETMGRRGLEVLGSADKQLVVVANCGHMMPLECGAESVPAALVFFDRLVAAGG
jgi:pimeloyl-ACP methyl ester carboxylesterase